MGRDGAGIRPEACEDGHGELYEQLLQSPNFI